MGMMNLREVCRYCDSTPRTILSYELIGRIRPLQSRNGESHYSLTDIEKLKFIEKALLAGFSPEECRKLLQVYFHQIIRVEPNASGLGAGEKLLKASEG